MRTFREYTTDDTLSPFFYQYGGSVLGPGMGQYQPTADLNAQKEREVKKSDLDQLERYADRLFASLGIDVEFTKHFLDRVNDERNVKQITPSELTRLFKQSYKKHGKTIAKLGADAEAVINDMKTDINMPFVLNLKGGELELVATTVMRKKDFKTPNRKLSFESYKRKTIKVGEDSVLGDGNPHYALVSDRKVVAIGTKEEMLELSDSQKGRVWLTKSKVGDIVESRAKKAVAGGKVQKLVTAHGLKFKGKVYKEIDMELVKINNSTQMVTFNIIHPKELFGNETNISFKALRRGPFMATDTSKINESKQEKEYVKDIAHTMKSKGHENLKKYADEFEKNALKSLNPRKELNKIPNINPKQVANLLNMSEMQKEEFRFFPKKVHKQITLPNPPTDTQREIAIVKKVIDARTSEDEESIKNHDQTPFYAIQEYCKENGLEFHDGEFEDVIKSVLKPIKHFKKKFNRPRPFQIDKDIKPFIETDTIKTRSYPSGHACQSMIVGLYVAGKFPTHREGVIKAAKEGGMTRVQAGFHFLSDYISGNLLAEKLYLIMNKDNYNRK